MSLINIYILHINDTHLLRIIRQLDLFLIYQSANHFQYTRGFNMHSGLGPPNYLYLATDRFKGIPEDVII